MNLAYQIILASKSPRRSQLLTEMAIPFINKTKEVEESYPDHLQAHEIAEFLSLKKANAFKDDLQEKELVITADTIVVFENKILGKPKDKEEVMAFLSSMSDRKHQVYTGVTLMTKENKHSFSDLSDVYFSPISTAEINHYIEHYNPFDKAGAYGIQEWFGHNFIHKIEGSYTNIMGLPTEKLYRALKDFAI